MNSNEETAQCITDLFGLIYRNLIRNENDSISFNRDSQSALLSVLLRNGPTKMSDIGRTLKVTKPNVTFLVDKLEEQGLILRQNDENDRRIVKICLTESGRKAIEDQKSELQKSIMKKLNLLTEHDILILNNSLASMHDIIGKLYLFEENGGRKGNNGGFDGNILWSLYAPRITNDHKEKEDPK
jgi:DNA-binding MarR family transcriptional regulator